MSTVSFDQSMEGMQAVALLNGQRLCSQPMRVRMDKKIILYRQCLMVTCAGLQQLWGFWDFGVMYGPGREPAPILHGRRDPRVGADLWENQKHCICCPGHR